MTRHAQAALLRDRATIAWSPNRRQSKENGQAEWARKTTLASEHLWSPEAPTETERAADLKPQSRSCNTLGRAWGDSPWLNPKPRPQNPL